ncbi:MAG: hypothetical protein OXR72_02210 [Gemmatimonadota bacterium]|nr:hypothetical protein [Gemmatimonadota bacterium]
MRPLFRKPSMDCAFSDPIARVEKVVLHGRRPRTIGRNARIGDHGPAVADPVVRISTAGGAVGIGWSTLDRERADALLGVRPSDLFDLPGGSTGDGAAIDLPLWDLAARCEGVPLYQLLGARGSREVELYDGSIYIDDLGVSDSEARRIFHEEVRTGHDYGYRNFKIKIGRGARWMPVREGTDRDVLVIRAVREAAGPDAKVLIDANNGTTLNIALDILERCRDVGVYWFEEPFPEDRAFNEAFKEAIERRGCNTFVADGESGPPPPDFFDMVENGWIDIVQHDFRYKGLTWWKATAECIEPWGAKCAPHCWGSVVERYAHAHFAASIPNYSLLEAAPAEMPGIALDGWRMEDGRLTVPDSPGAGFDVETDVLERGVTSEGGFRIGMHDRQRPRRPSPAR